MFHITVFLFVLLSQTLEDVFLQLCRLQDSEQQDEVECTSPLVSCLCPPWMFIQLDLGVCWCIAGSCVHVCCVYACMYVYICIAK